MSVAGRRGGRFVRRLATRLGGQGGHESASAIWETVQLARHQDRPYPLDYVARLFPQWEELHGDRLYGDDAAIVGRHRPRGVRPGGGDRPSEGPRHQREHTATSACPRPEGYRKAHAGHGAGRQASTSRSSRFIDTPGAYPGIGAEERGQGGAIAREHADDAAAAGAVVAVVIGEGGSGGALALGVADRVLMLENSTYSVISPEGAPPSCGATRPARATRRRRSSRRRRTATAGASPTWSSGARRRRAPRPRRGGAAARQLPGPLAARPRRAVALRAQAAAPGALPAHRRLPGDRGRRPDGDGGRPRRTRPPTGASARPRRRRARSGARSARGRSPGCPPQRGPTPGCRRGRRARQPTRRRR